MASRPTPSMVIWIYVVSKINAIISTTSDPLRNLPILAGPISTCMRCLCRRRRCVTFFMTANYRSPDQGVSYKKISRSRRPHSSLFNPPNNLLRSLASIQHRLSRFPMSGTLKPLKHPLKLHCAVESTYQAPRTVATTDDLIFTYTFSTLIC